MYPFTGQDYNGLEYWTGLTIERNLKMGRLIAQQKLLETRREEADLRTMVKIYSCIGKLLEQHLLNSFPLNLCFMQRYGLYT